MVLTKSFRESVMEEPRDKEYRRAFLREGIVDMLNGELDSAKMVLREYINGTVGFIKAGEDLGRSPKSLMRMLSQEGNPHARNLLELIAYLQKAEGVVVEVLLGDAVAGRIEAGRRLLELGGSEPNFPDIPRRRPPNFLNEINTQPESGGKGTDDADSGTETGAA